MKPDHHRCFPIPNRKPWYAGTGMVGRRVCSAADRPGTGWAPVFPKPEAQLNTVRGTEKDPPHGQGLRGPGGNRTYCAVMGPTVTKVGYGSMPVELQGTCCRRQKLGGDNCATSATSGTFSLWLPRLHYPRGPSLTAARDSSWLPTRTHRVAMKLAAASGGDLGTTVMVPNSLGLL